MSRRKLAAAAVGAVAGAGLAIYGIFLIYPPAAAITAGLTVVAISLFGIRIDTEEAEK